ncbi:Sec23/Sec24 trunk domain-containing protein [Blakeslea trispora]|nr:Sec23/Sec24 trunk domain-containing protein [Blakeslea trispora]
MNPPYQQPSMASSPSPTFQQATSPPTNSRRAKRHYPTYEQPQDAAYPSPAVTRQASPFPQQPYAQQQPAVPTVGMTTPNYLQPSPQPAAAYTQSPSLVNQTMHNMANMSLQSHMPSQDVTLVGQPPHIEDLEQDITLPSVPPQLTATGSSMAQVDSRLKHATVNAFPYSNSLVKKSKIPLALMLQPYLPDKQIQVPVVSDTTVARCSRCKTYINPFVQFSAGALKWKCNMCGMDNDVPQTFDWDVTTQQQTDRYSRHELNYGCVDFIAPADYIMRPPQPPVYVFVIDTSVQAIQSGMISVVADAILASLDKIPNEDGRTKVAFITADNVVAFYKLMGAEEPEILVVGDLSDIYLPRASSDLMVNLVESRKLIEQLLTKMKTMYNQGQVASNCLGSALQAARKLLSPTGGKVICFQASLPNVGEGVMKPKTATDKAHLNQPMMTPSSSFYKTFASECTKLQICADMFVFGHPKENEADVTTLNIIPRFTGGQTHFYPAFHATHQAECLRLKQEMMSLLEQQIGLEAVMRTRCSEGIVCHAFYGNCTTRVPDIMALPNVPRDQSYCVELVLEDEIQTSHVYFQTALLYTTCFGERRIRVMNLCLPVTKSLPELFSSVNQVALSRVLCHQAIDKAATGKLRDGRDHLANRSVEIIQGYSKEVLGSPSNAQLSVCRSLSLFPLLILSILKTPAFHDAHVPSDLRAQSAVLLRTLPVHSWIRLVHPSFYSVHNMPASAGTLDSDRCILPPVAHLSSERLEAHGCYMLYDIQNIYLWIGKQAVPPLCKDLLNMPSIQEVQSGQVPMLPQLSSPISQKLNAIIHYLQHTRQTSYYPTIYIVREDGDPVLRSRFLSHLIEDRQPTGPTNAGASQQEVSSGMSYFQWLGYVRAKSQ